MCQRVNFNLLVTSSLSEMCLPAPVYGGFVLYSATAYGGQIDFSDNPLE